MKMEISSEVLEETLLQLKLKSTEESCEDPEFRENLSWILGKVEKKGSSFQSKIIKVFTEKFIARKYESLPPIQQHPSPTKTW